MLSWCFAWLVWLLCACGVRRIKDLLRVCLYFISFASVFQLLRPSSGALSLLSSACPLVLFVFVCLWSLLFLFPLRTASDIKRKGTKVLPLCPLLFYCGCLDSCIVIKEFRSRCFGFFQFVRLVLPSNTARVGRLARSHLDFLRHYVDITYNRPAFLK